MPKIGNAIWIGGRGGGRFSFAPAQAPTLLTATTINGTRIDLAWTTNSGGIEDGFRIYISTDNITFTEKGTVLTGIVAYSATGLSNGTLYYFYSVAYKGTVESNPTNTTSATTWSAGEVAIRAGNTVAWYDSSDLTTITKDGSNLVSRWNDKLLSGNDLIQGTATNQPLWSTSGILFDGIDNFMLTGAIASLDQPTQVYLVYKTISWTNFDVIFDGALNNTGQFKMELSTPNLRCYAGANSTENSNLALNTWGIVRILFNGASSKLQINNTVAITGNFGASNMLGINLGRRAPAAGGLHGNFEIKEGVFRIVADNISNETAIYNYLAIKYGFPTI